MTKFILSIFLLSVFTTSYGEKISAYSENNPLLGTWKYSKTIVNVKTSDPAASRIIKEDILSEPKGTITFRQDGTGSSEAIVKEMNESFEYEFTYEVTDDSLIIYTEVASGESEPNIYKYTLSDRTLTLISDDTDEYDPDTLEDLEVENPDQVQIEKVAITLIYTRTAKATVSSKNL